MADTAWEDALWSRTSYAGANYELLAMMCLPRPFFKYRPVAHCPPAPFAIVACACFEFTDMFLIVFRVILSLSTLLVAYTPFLFFR
jgi:hypothetical protein